MVMKEPSFARRWRDFKCCAFQPFFANFLCGAMLEEGITPFRSVTKFTAQPLGLIPSAAFRESCDSVPDQERGLHHACAFYDVDQRACSVWKFRPGECSLYFCDSNPVREAWSEKSFALENGLAQMALVHLGFSSKEISDQVDELNSPRPSTASLSLKDAEEIYRASWAFARTQTRSDVDSWLGGG